MESRNPANDNNLFGLSNKDKSSFDQTTVIDELS